MSEIQKKVGVTNFVLEIKPVENNPELAHVYRVCSLKYR